MEHPLLDIGNDLPGIGLVPAPIEVLGGQPQLDDEVARQVLGLHFPALFPPQPHQRGLVIPHDDPGVRAADEVSSFCEIYCCSIVLRIVQVLTIQHVPRCDPNVFVYDTQKIAHVKKIITLL